MLVSASILSADFACLQEAVDSIPSADMLHIDVMDGHFVPNITFGPVIMDAIKTNKPFDVHLMVDKPEKFIPWFKNASFITFHAEAVQDPAKLISLIKSKGKKAGISIKPNTQISSIEDYLPKLNLVLVMSVEPGFSGQKFIENAIGKIRQLDAIRKARKLHFLISVDGGIDEQKAKLVRQAGADIVVAASYVFKAKNPDSAANSLKNA